MSTSERGQALTTTIQHRLKHELSVYVSAWLYFTRIPLPANFVRRLHPDHSLAQSARYAPIIGIGIGIVAALVFLGSHALFHHKGIAILLGLLTSTLLTAGMHEDGMAHFFDAFTGRSRSKKDILTQLKQQGIGAMGCLAIVFVLLLSYQALSTLSIYLIAVAFIASHAFARFAALSFVFTNKQADAPPSAAQNATPATFLVMAAFGMLPLLLTGSFLFLLLVPLLWIIRALFGLWFDTTVGGWTADGLSAVLMVTLVITFLLLAIAHQYTFSI